MFRRSPEPVSRKRPPLRPLYSCRLLTYPVLLAWCHGLNLELWSNQRFGATDTRCVLPALSWRHSSEAPRHAQTRSPPSECRYTPAKGTTPTTILATGRKLCKHKKSDASHSQAAKSANTTGPPAQTYLLPSPTLLVPAGLMRSQCKLRSGSSARRHAGRQLQSGAGVTQRSPDKTSLSAGTGPSILAAQGTCRRRKLAAVALAAAKARSTNQHDV